MKKRLFYLLLPVLLLFGSRLTGQAQTTLAAGDIAFIGLYTSGSGGVGDAFTFITLKALSAGTVIYFTDDGWNNGAWGGAASEVHFTWSPPAGGLPIGTIVTITGGAVQTVPGTPSIGTCSATFLAGTTWHYPTGEEILAYQSSTGARPASPTFIAGMMAYYNATIYNATTKWCSTTAGFTQQASTLPDGLTNGTDCVSVFNVTYNPTVANCRYNGSLTGTASAVRALINSDANWTRANTTPFDITSAAFPTPSITGSVAPTVTTQAVSSIAVTTATGNGNITSLGSPNPTQYGVCWNTGGTPTTSDSKTTQGAASATGAFTSSITGLSANTTYYVRAYATNDAGTVYGAEVTFTTLTNGTFTGATNNDWATAGNWAGGSVPTSSTDVTIPSGKTPVIGATTTADCNNLTITGSLTIQSSASGTGSLKVNGTSTGNVSCERYMTGSAWHVVSPIAAGGSISTFIQAGGNAIPSNSGNYGMMDYNETTNLWNSYFTIATAGNLTAGKGYSVRRTGDGVVTFTGTLTSGTKTVNLTKVGAEGWNCVGNPYTSAINMNTAAGASNFLATNSSVLDGSYACIYAWDDASSSYKILGNVSYGGRDLGQNVLQSGQGFFVKALNNSGLSVQFTSAMQVHSTGTALKSGETSWPGFELTATSSDVKASTVVAFNPNMTKGLDPTYDAGLLRGTSGVSLYTRLVDDNGVDFAIQCLPENDAKNMIIPIGLDCTKGGEVRFSVLTTSLPDGCSIILEDRASQTFTLLESGKELVATVAANTSGMGRFYIHTSYLTTGTSDLLPTEGFSLKAYPANKEIWIEGQVSSSAKAYLFNTSGSNLGVFNLQEGNRNSIPANGLATGVYLLKVTDGNKQFNTKIVIYE